MENCICNHQIFAIVSDGDSCCGTTGSNRLGLEAWSIIASGIAMSNSNTGLSVSTVRSLTITLRPCVCAADRLSAARDILWQT